MAAATSATQTAKAEANALQEQAQRHLWMHFTRMGSFDAEHEVPIIVRGEGCYVWDEHGNRYLDGLSALFCVNSGHGRTELGDAMAAQVRELDFITVWSYAHPRAIELATRIASLTPGDLNRVFFTNSGSEAVESAIKLSRSYHRARGNGQKTKLIAREIAYHGTTLGALSATGITGAAQPTSSPSRRAASTFPTRTATAGPPDRDPLWAADQIEERDRLRGTGDGRRRDPRAAAERRRLHPSPGRLLPAGPGDLRPLRRPLMVSDEVICAWGRLGHYFGCQRYGYQPDIVTVAKALTSAYVPMGGMIVSDRVFEPYSEGTAMFSHGSTFAGHPVAAATAMANLDVFEREDLCGHVRAKEGEFREALESLYDIPIVGDVRGDGFFYAIELVKDKETKESLEDEESEDCCAVICRASSTGAG